jgi:hypothetical protein
MMTPFTPLRTKRRRLAADLVRRLGDGKITNDEFDAQYPESEDRAIKAIHQFLWFHWDDRFSHILEGPYRLNKETFAIVDRCIAFLQKDLEYTGPLPMTNIPESIMRTWKSLLGKDQSPIQGSFEDPWWPFATEAQYLEHCHEELAPKKTVTT